MQIDPELQSLLERIHAAPHRLVLEFAGAGSLGLWWLHSVAGSSRTVLEATDRYSAPSLQGLLGSRPAQAVAVETGKAMARAAYWRALALSEEKLSPGQQAVPVLGVACTAAIATDRARRGEHRGVVVVQSAACSTVAMLTLAKGQRDRLAEETLLARLLLQTIARACGIDQEVALDLGEGDSLEEHSEAASDPLARLLAGQEQTVQVYPDGQQVPDARLQGVLLSGAFNPLHQGHTHLLAAAADMLGMPAVFELPIINADKGTLIAEEVVRRLRQFAGQYTVALSRAPLFVEKAALFPGCVFVVGYDTAVRLVNPRYYGGQEGMQAAFEQIRAAGCRFLVAGRREGQQFLTLHDIALPPALHDLFLELPESRFREDISSTELRERAAQQ